jgi:1,4-alpha-glucan branching enzyme
MIQPSVNLIAEDHSGWDAVTKLPAQGGLGFDANWEAAFCHHLVGDSDMAGGKARLLRQAGFGGNEPLQMDRFSGALYESRHNQVIYHESHDEAGNAGGTARTIVIAVNGAPLVGATRTVAEARCRVCTGLTVLSAGTPMFFMGEEIGAQKRYTYDNFVAHREDILGEREGNGSQLYRCYRDLVSLRRRFRSLCSHDVDILHHSNANRVIAFKRWSGDQQAIVVASLNNAAFRNGYAIEKNLLAIPNAGWKEVLNSDAARYGGEDVGNDGAILFSDGGRLDVILPANGFIVLIKQ